MLNIDTIQQDLTTLKAQVSTIAASTKGLRGNLDITGSSGKWMRLNDNLDVVDLLNRIGLKKKDDAINVSTGTLNGVSNVNGTIGKYLKFLTSTTAGNSLVNEVGSLVHVAGSLLVDAGINANLFPITNVPDPTANLYAANKEYVDLAASSIELSELFTSTASSVAGYNALNESLPSVGTVVSADVIGSIGSPTALFKFITIAGRPGLDRFLKGTYDCHVHLRKTTGAPNNKLIAMYCEVWRCDSAGADISKLGTSDDLITGLTTSDTAYNTEITISTETPLDVTDRIAVKWFAYVLSGGGTYTVTLYVGGSDDSHLSLRVSPFELNNIFAPALSLTPGYIPVATGTGTTLGNSNVWQSSYKVGIGGNWSLTNLVELHISNNDGLRISGLYATDSPYLNIVQENPGYHLFAGLESSRGGILLPGSTPNSGIINVYHNAPLQLGTNNTVRMTIDGTTGYVSINNFDSAVDGYNILVTDSDVPGSIGVKSASTMLGIIGACPALSLTQNYIPVAASATTLGNSNITSIAGSVTVRFPDHTGATAFNWYDTVCSANIATLLSNGNFSTIGTVTIGGLAGSAGYLPLIGTGGLISASNIYQDGTGKIGIGLNHPVDCLDMINGSGAGVIQRASSATGYPFIQMYRGTTSLIGLIQAGVNKTGANGDYLLFGNPIATTGGMVFFVGGSSAGNECLKLYPSAAGGTVSINSIDITPVAEYDYFSSSSIGGGTSATGHIAIAKIGKRVDVIFDISETSTGGFFTFTLPFANSSLMDRTVIIYTVDATINAGIGYGTLPAGSSTFSGQPSATGTWTTGSTGKQMKGQFTYYTA